MEVPKEKRLARYQELYDRGGVALWWPASLRPAV